MRINYQYLFEIPALFLACYIFYKDLKMIKYVEIYHVYKEKTYDYLGWTLLSPQ